MTEQESLGPGYHVLNHAKLGMFFCLHLPEVNTYQALVLALHYGGPRNVFTGSELLHKLIVPALEQLNPVFLAPVCKTPTWEHPEAGVNVLAMVEEMVRAFDIKPSRVVIIGYSMGGTGAWHLAKTYPDKFAAIVPVSAQPVSDLHVDGWRVPVFAIHSRADQVFAYQATEAAIAELRRRNVNAMLTLRNDLGHFETDRFIQPLRQALPWLRNILAKA